MRRNLSVLVHAGDQHITSMHYTSVHVFYRLVLILLLLQPFRSLASDQYGEVLFHEQRIAIEYHESLNAAERKMTHQWLQEVAAALLTVYGELPEDYYQVSIERSSRVNSPVPWGHVERGSPTNVLLVINPDLGYQALIDDWTAFHELSHLLIPYRGHGNIWLSEGLATYYQNIIQARSGQFDEKKLWNKIVAGFNRGSNDQRWRHMNLSEVSDKLGETRQYMRVHWSGVLFWLTADVELRKQGKSSLDAVLKQLRNCCAGQLMSAEEIVRKLDELSNETMFVPLFDKYCKSYATPEFGSILTDLGVKQDTLAGSASFDNDAPLADIRQQIYQK